MNPTTPDFAASPITAESLLQYEPFVRAIARKLLSSEAQVQDIVQETWLRALRRPPTRAAAIKGWLASVTGNAARDVYRREARRRAREQEAARGEREESVEATQERLDAHRLVVDAVLALAEPYKSVVLLSYYQELSPARIAERLGRKPATVRSQLHRAHQLLREELDEEFGGDRKAWAVLLAPMLESPPVEAGLLPALSGLTGASLAALVALIAFGAFFFVPGLLEGDTRQGADGGGLQRIATPEEVASSVSVDDTRPAVTSREARAAAERESLSGDPVPATVSADEAEEGFAVRVIDREGRPVAGVPVDLRWKSDDDSYGRLVTVATGMDGRVVFPDYRGLLHLEEDLAPDFSARLGVPGSSRKSVDVDWERVGEEPPELVLGATASLEIRTVDPLGRSLPVHGTASVSERGMAWKGWPVLKGELVDGMLRLEHVGLGVELEATVVVLEDGVRWKSRGAGPTVEGKGVVLEVVAPQQPRLTGRIVDFEGEPFAGKKLQFTLRDEADGQLQSTGLVTDEDGGFTAELVEGIEMGAHARPTFLWYVFGQCKARADLSRPILVGPGVHELGELRLRPLRGKIGGFCVDESGDPVEGVKVSAPHIFARNTSLDRTGTAGRFDLGGPFPDELELEVESERLVPREPATVGAEEREIEIVLVPGGEFRGNVVPREGVRWSEVFVTVWVSSLENPSRTDYSRWLQIDERDGSFNAEGLDSGTYTCLFHHGGERLLELKNVIVTRSQLTVDPRLHDVDPWGELHSVHLRLVDGGGRAIPDAHASEFQNGKFVDLEHGDEGRIELRYGKPERTTILAHAPGYRSILLPGTIDDREVVLEPGIHVTLTTEDRPKLKQGDRTARLSLAIAEVVDGLPAGTHAVPLPGSLLRIGSSEVVFPRPGAYRLYVSIDEPTTGGMMMGSVAAPVAGELLVEVRETDDGGTLPIGLPESLF